MALYNQGFPIGYNPNQFYNPQPSQFTQQPQTQQDLIWVQGGGAAKAYLISPGKTVALWDTEAPMIYLKSADMYGKPSTITLRYQQVSSQDELNMVPDKSPEYITVDNIGKYIEAYLSGKEKKDAAVSVPNVTSSATTIEPPWAADKSV